jgi:ribosomal protein S19E (S16A)
MLSIIEKRSKDEAKQIDWRSKENSNMLSALEQLGLVEKRKKGYVVSKKGKNILHYFRSSAGSRGESHIISNK